ncbi:hypothetical protein Vadar_022522 [Vaccinium darrowii]|uniref:Uncharacterized protein n=1 Tax=Vaccinium darrowii TaxID=229202 RepID=A0ACB7Y0Z9_9ERIC|nr:hypothetical protein Vadar_022522 [Vaccinium darrowii]
MQSLLLEILADKATKGNKPSNIFRPGSFAKVAKEITKKYGVECQSKHMENRLKTIESTWKIIFDLRYMKSGFGWDDNLRIITCGKQVFDEYIAAHLEHETFFNKKIEMYDEMSLVVGKDMATGQFAKSFDDIEEETVAESDYIDFGVAEISKGKCIASSRLQLKQGLTERGVVTRMRVMTSYQHKLEKLLWRSRNSVMIGSM